MTVDTDRLRSMAANLATIRQRIKDAAEHAGRNPDEIQLVAVSKGIPAEVVASAAELGIASFGENRVAEAKGKIDLVSRNVSPNTALCWHMIGHLQTNKARGAVALFTSIQSVDSIRLAEILSREAGLLDRRIPLLIEVNVAREPAKFGLLPEDVPAAAQAIAGMPHLTIRGLMTVAPFVSNPEEVRPVFRELRALRSRLRELVPNVDWHDLSMGMSSDFTVAIEEGATIVRIGRALFGDRTTYRL